MSRVRSAALYSILSFFFLCASGVFTAAPALASTQCSVDATYGSVCVSQVQFAQFYTTAYQTQQQSEWCWAASIAMLWAFYGHPISQSEIVSSVYGGVQNIPAQAGYQLVEVLNGQRVDDNGRSFLSTVTGVYDATANVATLTYDQIAGALDGNQPVILGLITSQGSGHAVVLTQITYYQIPGSPYAIDPSGYNILGGGIFDPWPGNGAQSIAPNYLSTVTAGGNLQFAATVKVQDVATGSTSGTMATSGGGGSAGTLAVVAIFVLICRLLRFQSASLRDKFRTSGLHSARLPASPPR